MALPEENVHDLTLRWWSSLPWAYRDADARQGYNVGPPWGGLNRDPRFVTGFDSWARTNTSTRPWEASVAFTRRFNVEPGAPVLVRSWHTPTPLGDLTNTTSELGEAALGLMALGETTTTVRVHHTIRNHTGTVVSETTADLTGDPGQHVDTWWSPDRFGVLHATVEVTVNVPGFMDALQAIHVGLTEEAFEDLPDAASFKIARPYPLLRFMDGVGFQAGIVSDTVEQMHNGGWTDPATAPDIALPYLAAILGLPTDYTDTLTTARLREHLVGLIDGGTPSAGTTAAITAVAKQWLTGDKQVAVIPAHTLPEYDNHPDNVRLHTLILLCRADEVPNGDLPAFQQFLNNSGVVPAGHELRAREATPTWEQWQTYVGDTWATMQTRAPRWVDHHSAGINLGDQP